jgi:ubiquinone/menaquinone biosynthesis C-methylase UbiE
MPLPSDHHKDHPSTYFVQDRTNKDERTRVQIQDTMITKEMGGVLPEQADPTRFRQVIDVGCGTGGWLIATAKTYPDISSLVGIDISNRMVEFARKQAKAELVDDRVDFQVMDALRLARSADNLSAHNSLRWGDPHHGKRCPGHKH